MADNDMLQEELGNTPSASPAGTTDQVLDSGTPLTGTEQQTPEEVEFNKLKGNTQDRIRELIQEKKALEERVAMGTTPTYNPPPPPMYSQPAPDVQDAVRKLSDVGIATKDFVSEQVSANLNNLRYQFELERLGEKYSGDDGRPKFDRSEYEDYIARHQEYRGYLPEDVYEKMYREELHDWDSQRGSSPQSKFKTLKPTRTAEATEPLSAEMIEQRLKEPDGQQWYVKNIDKINAVLGKTRG